MNLNKIQFLGLEPEFTDFKKSAVTILPFPYEGGVSYGRGTKRAPSAVLKASQYLELYDEVYNGEFYSMGISTVKQPKISGSPEKMIDKIYGLTSDLIKKNKFVCVIGGDHSISSGFFRALNDYKGVKSVIQFDAHTDLRDSYEGSKLSHACVTARIREITKNTLHIGIRSMCAQEAEKIKTENIKIITMHDLRSKQIKLESFLKELPDPVFITFDVDALDWSVVCSTGTPEPGGLLWHETLSMLEKIFFMKNVAGIDIVELSGRKNDHNSPFAVAKLLYKMITLKAVSFLKQGKVLPQTPSGPIF